MTADVTREPTGGQELRKAIAAEQGRHRWYSSRPGGIQCSCGWLGPRPDAGQHLADAVLALPALAALLADADNWRRATTGDPMQARVQALEATVTRVRGLADSLDVDSCDPMPDDRSRLLFDTAQRIRAAVGTARKGR